MYIIKIINSFTHKSALSLWNDIPKPDSFIKAVWTLMNEMTSFYEKNFHEFVQHLHSLLYNFR